MRRIYLKENASSSSSSIPSRNAPAVERELLVVDFEVHEEFLITLPAVFFGKDLVRAGAVGVFIWSLAANFLYVVGAG